MTDQPSHTERPSANPRSGWWSYLLVGTLVAIYLFTTRPAPLPEGWGTDFEAALATAATDNRMLLVAFHTSRCPPCTAMDRSVLGTPEVASALKDFIPVRADLGEARQLARSYGVFMTPTYAVIDRDGRVVARTEGYQEVPAFVSFLKSVPRHSTSGTARAAEAPPDGP